MDIDVMILVCVHVLPAKFVITLSFLVLRKHQKGYMLVPVSMRDVAGHLTYWYVGLLVPSNYSQ